MYKGEFFFSCSIPSSKTPIPVKEISVGEYLSLLKFLKNADLKNIEYFINHILKTLVLEKYEMLNVIDKFTILLTVRSIILGNEVQLLMPDNQRIKISIDDIIESILEFNPKPSTYVSNSILTIELDYPRNFFNEKTDPFLNSIVSIQDTRTSQSKIYFSSLTEEEREQISNKLPLQSLQDIQKEISNYKKDLENIILFKTTKDSVRLNPFDDSLIRLLMILLSDDLKSLYDVIYTLISKANFSWADILSMNPAEMQLFYNRLAIENKEAQTQSQTPQSPIHAIVDSLK